MRSSEQVLSFDKKMLEGRILLSYSVSTEGVGARNLLCFLTQGREDMHGQFLIAHWE